MYLVKTGTTTEYKTKDLFCYLSKVIEEFLFKYYFYIIYFRLGRLEIQKSLCFCFNRHRRKFTYVIWYRCEEVDWLLYSFRRLI